MFAATERRLRRILEFGAGTRLRSGQVGLERECLRVAPKGTIARTPHPAVLGSALTHPYITTDFSEALLELITPPSADSADALAFLRDAQTYVYRQLEDEVLWSASMPCILDDGAEIPLAYYGTSNAGRMKTLYRRGLGYRYGRTMQVIAGVHFNYSVGEDLWPILQEVEQNAGDLRSFVSESYIGLIRNLQRFGWLVPYLSGASPAVCKSFVKGRGTDMSELDPSTYYYPHATSLRLGDIGYQNRLEEGTGMKANYDSLDAYVRSLTWAIETPCPQYEEIGVKVDGEYRQLNANVLQIENEYYSTVRPKQLLEGLEKPTAALRRRGVRYVEVRSLDVDPFDPLGVSIDQLRFMETFVLFCLLVDSPRINSTERAAIDRNQALAAHQGRAPGLELERDRIPVPLRQWADELLSAMEPVAELLDGCSRGPYRESWERQRAKVREPELTPSARMLAEMRANDESFYDFARRVSEHHRQYFADRALGAEREALFRRLAEDSLEQQAYLEQSDRRSFDDFLGDYFATR